MLSSMFGVILFHKPTEVVIAVDKSSWRKTFYPEYKAQRAAAREKEDVDWPVVLSFLSKFIQELKEVFPFKVIRCELTEADDIISVICLDDVLSKDENVIVSSDKDFLCLLEKPTVRMWNPIKSEFTKCENPKLALQIHILVGDKSDNIPSVIPRVGEKRATALLESGKLQEKLGEKAEYQEAFSRNKILIDPAYIPDTIKRAILKQMREYSFVRTRKVQEYLKAFKLNNLLSRIDEIEQVFQLLSGEKDDKGT